MRLRHRWLLPLGHLAVDVIVLVLWLWHADTIRHRMKAFPAGVVLKPVMMQEAGAPGWDFRRFSPPDEAMFLGLGSAPAFMVTSIAGPDFYPRKSRRMWDPRWFLIQELVSFPVWLAIGAYADRGSRKFAKWMYATFSCVARLQCLSSFNSWPGSALFWNSSSGSASQSTPASRDRCGSGNACINLTPSVAAETRRS
jgi:hypothetical protein